MATKTNKKAFDKRVNDLREVFETVRMVRAIRRTKKRCERMFPVGRRHVVLDQQGVLRSDADG